jgi:hypothetical protein
VAQHDYVIANGTGAAVRSDLNNALAAIVSQNSGATEPATMYAYQWWADTSTGLLKLRNAANNAWITLRELDGTLTIEAGTVSAPGLAFASDLNTGIYSPSADQLAIATNGVERVEWGTTEVVFNDGGANYDFRIEGDTNANLFFVDASADAVGLGTSTPNSPFEVGTLGINFDGAIAALPSSGADSAAFIARTASTGSAPFDQAGSIIYRPRVSSTAGRSSHIFYTGSPSAIRMVINEAGNVGIGTTTPLALLNTYQITGGAEAPVLFQNFSTTAGTSVALYLSPSGGSLTTGSIRAAAIKGIADASNIVNLAFFTNSSGADPVERARIDSSGRLLVGTSSARGGWYNSSGTSVSPVIQTDGTSFNTSSLALAHNENSAGEAARILLGKSRGSTAGSFTVVQNGDDLGGIAFQGADGTNFVEGAHIKAFVDGAPGADDLPTRLVFSTTADSASSPTERMRITSTGQVRLAGAGITFNGDTAAANELDDYEEGTFTPVIEGTTSAGTGTYGVQVGRYTKVGNRVFYNLYVVWTAHTGTGNMQLNGLPFTSSAVTNSFAAAASWEQNLAMTAGSIFKAYTATNSTIITLRQLPTGGGASAAIPIDSAAEIMLSGHYFV